jgi:16S rRNA (guanine527-N7)-methyltransferase
MIDTSSNREYLDKCLSGFDIQVSEQQLSLLLSHLDLVVEKNKVMNLTRIVDPSDAIIRHVVDSLLLLPSLGGLGLNSDTYFVDVGTGAGFPGIPLAITTGYKGLLIDSVGKKVVAVNEFCKALGIDHLVQGQSVRAKDLARSSAKSFDVVTARAVAELGVLIEYASPLLKKAGYLVVSKARISDDEMSQGTKVGEIVGLHLVSRETYELPNESGHREILTFIHDTKSKVKLPRNTGMAKHHPLA